MSRNRSPIGRPFRASVAALILGGLLGASVRGEQDPADTKSPEGQAALDLSAKYRFIERYSAPGSKPDPLSIGQYLVGIRETREQVVEARQGAPERVRNVFHTRFSERAARVLQSGEVTDTVRRYATFRMEPAPAKATDQKPIDGLTLWYHSGGGYRSPDHQLDRRTPAQ